MSGSDLFASFALLAELDIPPVETTTTRLKCRFEGQQARVVLVQVESREDIVAKRSAVHEGTLNEPARTTTTLLVANSRRLRRFRVGASLSRRLLRRAQADFGPTMS